MDEAAMTTYSSPTSPIFGGRFGLAPFWRDMTPGWHEVPFGALRPSFGILAYSGGAHDADLGKIWLFGGGHNDSWGNDVWEFDLEAFDWVQKYEPDWYANPPIEDYFADIDMDNRPGVFISSGRPYSRHTYNGVVWLKHLGKMMATGASAYSGSGEYLWGGHAWYNSPADTNIYDPVANTWDWKGSARVDANYGNSVHFDYDVVTGKVFGFWRDAHFISRVAEYNPNTNVWTKHTASGGGDNSEQAVMMDSTRRELYRLYAASGDAVFQKYHVENETWTTINAASTPNWLYGAGMAHHRRLDEYYVFGGQPGGGAWKYSHQSNAFTTVPGFPTAMNQVYSRAWYDEKRDVMLVCFGSDAAGVRIFALKV